jgi:hypothetical protein
MRRLLFTVLLCALGATQASAQNRVSEQLFDLDDNERNEAFTFILRDNDRKCDQVVRTIFNGSVLGVDEWEALCRDRNSYSISVLAELEDTIVTVLSCRELSTTSKMLLHKAGSRSKAARCKVK